MTARPLEVSITLKDEHQDAKYNPKTGMFEHNAFYASLNPFSIQKTTMTSGQYNHSPATVAAPAVHGDFETLPLEVRQLIYKHVFEDLSTITISKSTKTPSISSSATAIRRSTRSKSSAAPESDKVVQNYLGIILTNRARGAEALPYLYLGHEFDFNCMDDLNRWAVRIASNIQYVNRITVRRSGKNLLKEFYSLLAEAKHLAQVRVTLSFNFEGTVRDHYTDHWNKGEVFFVGEGVSKAEGERHVKLVEFEIGPKQTSVVEGDEVVTEISGKAREDCRKVMKRWVAKYADERESKRAAEERRKLK